MDFGIVRYIRNVETLYMRKFHDFSFQSSGSYRSQQDLKVFNKENIVTIDRFVTGLLLIRNII